nr:MAG TPA: hypothetical protein [Caudoviricetes sp.]
MPLLNHFSFAILSILKVILRLSIHSFNTFFLVSAHSRSLFKPSSSLKECFCSP